MKEKEEKFKLLFHTHYEAMYRQAFILLHDMEESRDAVSDVFSRLWDNPTSIDRKTERAFLLTCIRHQCLNIIAKKGLDEKLRKLYPLEQELTLVWPLEKEQQLITLRQVIDRELTPQSARILHLRYYEDKSYKETADALGISVAAVNKHVVKALRKLREKMKS